MQWDGGRFFIRISPAYHNIQHQASSEKAEGTIVEDIYSIDSQIHANFE